MSTQVYLEKRKLKTKKRNGQHNYRWSLRWFDEASGAFKCESTGTADKVQAEALQKVKWEQLNIPGMAPEPEPVAVVKPSWDECRTAVERAMTADNLRPNYIDDARQNIDRLRKAFPGLASPADVTPEHANEFKRRRAELGHSPWSIRGDLSTLKAVFGKWLCDECGLLKSNPFAKVKAPRCDDPEIRIVSAAESQMLFDWFAERWNNWRLPLVYLDVAAVTGWRATEIASIREQDILADGYVTVIPETSKTRKQKTQWLPPELCEALRACCADGWAFGRFSDELRRLVMVWKRQPNHAARVKDFSPRRMVAWLQDEMARFNADQTTALAPEPWLPITLHDFRRTTVTALQSAGVSAKVVGLLVGATEGVMAKHYEKFNQQELAKQAAQQRLAGEGANVLQMQQSLRARYARGENGSIDATPNHAQTITA